MTVIQIGGTTRYVAVEDAAKYRDALGIPLPHGLPESLLEPAMDPLSAAVPGQRIQLAQIVAYVDIDDPDPAGEELS